MVSVPLASPFTLAAADGMRTPYSNYTSGYKALLDYVWLEPAALQVRPMCGPVVPRTHALCNCFPL